METVKLGNPLSGQSGVGPAFVLMSHSRTCSNLLERMLSKQPNTLYFTYPFFDSRQTRIKMIENGTLSNAEQQEKDYLYEAFHNGYVKLLEVFAHGQAQHKRIFVPVQPHQIVNPLYAFERICPEEFDENDIPKWRLNDVNNASALHTNPTVLPDAALLMPGIKPVFGIRHPIRTFDGIYRASHKVYNSPKIFNFQTTFRWSRLLYDWYEVHGPANGIYPCVIDADDFMGPEKEKVMRNLCSHTGFDDDAVIYQWPKATDHEINGMSELVRNTHESLLKSEGIVENRGMAGTTLEAEFERWKTQYGEQVAHQLVDAVNAAMPDYNYLYSKRIQA